MTKQSPASTRPKPSSWALRYGAAVSGWIHQTTPGGLSLALRPVSRCTSRLTRHEPWAHIDGGPEVPRRFCERLFGLGDRGGA